MAINRGNGPKIGGWRLPAQLSEGAWEDLQDEALHEAMLFKGLDLSGMDLAGSTFEQCSLQSLTAQDTQLRASRWLRVSAQGLDAPVLHASRMGLREVEFGACRLGSADLHQATLENVVLSECRISWLNLNSARLKDVLIRDCVIDELDLGQANIERVSFQNVEVKTLSLGGAKMRHMDLRGARLRTISGLDSLRGSIITPEQLQALASLFAEQSGITVKE